MLLHRLILNASAQAWKVELAAVPALIRRSSTRRRLLMERATTAPSRLMRATPPRAVEDDVLGLLDVEVGLAQMIEDVREHAGRSRWRTTSMCVAGVRFARFTTFGTRPVLVGADDAHRLGGDRLLRLVGRRADVMRAVDAGQRDRAVGEIARSRPGSFANTSRPTRRPRRGRPPPAPRDRRLRRARC